jgi:hypothetical protein
MKSPSMHAKNPVLLNQSRFLVDKEIVVQLLQISMHILFVINGSWKQGNAVTCEHSPEVPTNTVHGVEHKILEQPIS